MFKIPTWKEYKAARNQNDALAIMLLKANVDLDALGAKVCAAMRQGKRELKLPFDDFPPEARIPLTRMFAEKGWVLRFVPVHSDMVIRWLHLV